MYFSIVSCGPAGKSMYDKVGKWQLLALWPGSLRSQPPTTQNKTHLLALCENIQSKSALVLDL